MLDWSEGGREVNFFSFLRRNGEQNLSRAPNLHNKQRQEKKDQKQKRRRRKRKGEKNANWLQLGMPGLR